MKTLPVLSSSFPYFSWTTQFGNATSTQLQNGYLALTSEGETTEFHRFIWNDMVALLARALSDANLTWNNTYGTAKETKVYEKYGILTAKKFNAMTINIDQVINNAWRWEVDRMYAGYVARPRFYGITEKKAKADYLYGQFIIELARVLNLFIAILKNEADFSEFNIAEISRTPTDVNLLPRTSAPMFYAKSSTSNTKEVVLLNKPSRPMYLSLYSSTQNNVDMLKRPSRILTSKQQSKSRTNANLTAQNRVRASYRDFIKSLHDATAQRTASKSIGTFKDTTKTTIEAQMAFFGCIDMFYEEIHKSIHDSKIDIVPSTIFDANIYDTSISKSYIDKLQAYTLGQYQGISNSNSKSEVTATQSYAMPKSDNQSFSINASFMHIPFVLNNMDSSDLSFSMQESEMLQKESMPIQSESISASQNESDVIVAQPKYIEAEELSTSNNDADIIVGKPQYIEATETSEITQESEVHQLASVRFTATEKANTDDLTMLSKSLILQLSSQVKSKTKSKVSLGYDAVEEAWHVQTDSDLYIKQIYDGYREESDLYIDTGIWLAPIQNGTDLFIQQIYDTDEVKGE